MDQTGIGRLTSLTRTVDMNATQWYTVSHNVTFGTDLFQVIRVGDADSGERRGTIPGEKG